MNLAAPTLGDLGELVPTGRLYLATEPTLLRLRDRKDGLRRAVRAHAVSDADALFARRGRAKIRVAGGKEQSPHDRVPRDFAYNSAAREV